MEQANLVKNNHLKNRLIGAGLATVAILSPNLNQEISHADKLASQDISAQQAIGSWAVSYSCQTDIFSVTAQNPSPSEYEINMFSHSNQASAVLRDITVTDQASIDLDISMLEAETYGIIRDENTEIGVIDKLDNGNIMTGTIVNTLGCPKDPEPIITPEPTPTESPSVVITPTPTPSSTFQPRIQQYVKMPKNKYKVGKKIKMAMRTKTGAPTTWATLPSRNKRNKKTCKASSKFIKLEKNRPLLKTKIKTLHPGVCKFAVSSYGVPGEDFLLKRGSFRVTKKNYKPKK